MNPYSNAQNADESICMSRQQTKPTKFAPGDLAIYAKHCEEEKRYAMQNIQI
jgi:hypothetical protein